MAEKTLYDILEVSQTASDEAIRAAYERLVARLIREASGKSPDDSESLRLLALREAFLTLGNPQKRAQYDRRLAAEWLAPKREPFWSVSRAIVVLLALAVGAIYLWHDRRAQTAALEAQKAIAAEKTREEAARLEAERLRLEREAQAARTAANEAKLADEQRRARDADLRAFESSQRTRERENQVAAERELAAKRSAEAQRRRDAEQAAAAARQQVARDMAELCRLERQRYGKALSC